MKPRKKHMTLDVRKEDDGIGWNVRVIDYAGEKHRIPGWQYSYAQAVRTGGKVRREMEKEQDWGRRWGSDR